MTNQPTTPKRWRPRFSVRTLVVLVTLVCSYFGCWEVTKSRGVRDVRRGVSPMPFIVRVDMDSVIGSASYVDVAYRERSYYFWFFGYFAKLPFERDIIIQLQAPTGAQLELLELMEERDLP